MNKGANRYTSLALSEKSFMGRALVVPIIFSKKKKNSMIFLLAACSLRKINILATQLL